MDRRWPGTELTAQICTVQVFLDDDNEHFVYQAGCSLHSYPACRADSQALAALLH